MSFYVNTLEPVLYLLLYKIKPVNFNIHRQFSILVNFLLCMHNII